MGGGARESPLDRPTEHLDPEERAAMIGGAFAQAIQRQALDTRKERMASVKESNATRAAAFIGA